VKADTHVFLRTDADLLSVCALHAVIDVIFGHINCSFYLLIYLLTYLHTLTVYKTPRRSYSVSELAINKEKND